MARTPPRLEYSSRQHDAILKPKMLFSKCQWFKIETLILHWLLDRYYRARTAPQQLPRIPILICLKTIPATGRAGSIGL